MVRRRGARRWVTAILCHRRRDSALYQDLESHSGSSTSAFPRRQELDALEAFQLSLGRQKELALPLPLKGTVAKRGQELFLSPTEGKCFSCHAMREPMQTRASAAPTR